MTPKEKDTLITQVLKIVKQEMKVSFGCDYLHRELEDRVRDKLNNKIADGK